MGPSPAPTRPSGTSPTPDGPARRSNGTPEKRRVFVSHSRTDKDGQLFVHTLLAGSDFEPYFYTVENPTPPHAERIRTEVENSYALFVVLSEPMAQRDSTRAWSGYEVGIASAHNVPVVVIEPEDSPVPLQVPGATHYLRRPATLRRPFPKEWEVIAQTAGYLKPAEQMEYGEKWTENIIATLYNVSTVGRDSTDTFYKATCQRTTCRARFYVPLSLSRSKHHPCPSCRSDNVSLTALMVEWGDAPVKGSKSGGQAPLSGHGASRTPGGK